MGIKKVFKNGKNDKDGYIVLETGKDGKGIKTNLPSDKVKKGISSGKLPTIPKKAKSSDIEANIPTQPPVSISSTLSSSELVLNELSKNGKYRIIVDGNDLHSRVNVKFINLEDGQETSVPQDLIWGAFYSRRLQIRRHSRRK